MKNISQVYLKKLAFEVLTHRKNISRRELARALGITMGHLSKLVNGVHPVNRAPLRKKFQKVLSADFDSLFLIRTGYKDSATE